MDRLTKWSGDRADCNVGYCPEDCSYCERFKEIREKLARHEDLEESGRLVILPEGLKTEELLKVIAENACPRWVGLADSKGTPVCDRGGENCLGCWQEALKGEKDG